MITKAIFFFRQIILNKGFYRDKNYNRDLSQQRLEALGHSKACPQGGCTETPLGLEVLSKAGLLASPDSGVSVRTARGVVKGTGEKPGLISLEVKVKVTRAGKASAQLRTGLDKCPACGEAIRAGVKS